MCMRPVGQSSISAVVGSGAGGQPEPIWALTTVLSAHTAAHTADSGYHFYKISISTKSTATGDSASTQPEKN